MIEEVEELDDRLNTKSGYQFDQNVILVGSFFCILASISGKCLLFFSWLLLWVQSPSMLSNMCAEAFLSVLVQCVLCLCVWIK